MASIFDVFGRVLLDDAGFQADVKRSGDKAGATLGKSMSSRMGPALKASIGGAIGGVLAGGFAIAAKGAAELDAATNQLVADTGLVGPAAAEASDQIASMYRDNLQGFDQIGAALAKVHTDLGLTGQAAGDTTGLFLKFSTATGEDAASAIAGADDTLDAFNLTAGDSEMLLDKLIVSHQRYGGSINESQGALAKIAPALTSFGLGLDDGIGLLNLFNTAGVDASKMPAALTKALGKVKSPAEFKALLQDIKDTKDPFLQAQKAIDLFGAKAGPQLAQALRQGNLDDFVISMEDAKGATLEAADAVESGFGNQFKLILKNAGGALAEFGSNFGPLLLVGAQIGPKLASSIGAGIGGLATVLGPKLAAAFAGLLPVAVASGTAQGVAMGGATAAATISTELGAEVAATVAASELPVAVAAHTGIGTAAGGAAATAEVATEAAGVTAGQAVVATTAAPAAAAAGTTIGSTMGAAAGLAFKVAMGAAVVLAAALAAEEIHKMISPEGGLEGRIKANKTMFGDELAWPFGPKNTPHVDLGPFKDVLGGDSTIHASTTESAGKAADDIAGRTSPAATALPKAADALAATALTLGTLQSDLHKDFQEATAALRKANDPKAIAAAVERITKAVLDGVGNSKQTAALVDDLTARRDAALAAGDKALADTLSAEIRKISPLVAGRAHQAALLAQGTAVVNSNKSVKDKVAELTRIQQELKGLGRTAAAAAIAKQIETITAIKALPAGMKNALGGLLLVATPAGKGADDLVVPKAPPRPRSGGPSAKVVDDERRHMAAGGRLGAGMPAIVNERGTELFVPNSAGRLITAAKTAALLGSPAARGGDRPPISVTVQGLLRARDPFELATQMRRLSSFGVLTPRPEPK